MKRMDWLDEWTGIPERREAERLRRRWAKAQRGRVRLCTPLPRRVRARLAMYRAIDGTAAWLSGRPGGWRLAAALYRATGMVK